MRREGEGTMARALHILPRLTWDPLEDLPVQVAGVETAAVKSNIPNEKYTQFLVRDPLIQRILLTLSIKNVAQLKQLKNIMCFI